VKPLPALLSCLGLVLIGAASLLPKKVFINESPSMRRGIYLLLEENSLGNSEFRVGDTVLISLPRFLREFSKTHSFLSSKVPLLKKVAAKEGDKVCGVSKGVSVNERELFLYKELDGEGKPLPKWTGCEVLKKGEFFAVGENPERSFDGRYFGPLEESLIVGKVKLLFEF
jgi:type IV secretory pathway protease TraF